MTLFPASVAISTAVVVGMAVFLIACHVVRCLSVALLELAVEAWMNVSELTLTSILRFLATTVVVILLMSSAMWIACTVTDLIKG